MKPVADAASEMRISNSLRPRVSGGQRGIVGAMRRPPRVTASGVRRPQSERLRRRQRWYFALMGVCLVLILLAWNLVRLWSTTAAVAMSIVAAVLPPIAVVIANWGEDR
jgi:Flp pilus assembly protein TadB